MNDTLVKLSATRFRLSAFVECVVFVGATLFVNKAWFPATPGFHGWAFNPYLMVVILLSSRYGLAVGLLSALLSSACFVGVLWELDAGSAGLTFLTPAHGAVPLSFLAAAVFCGGFAERWKSIVGMMADRYDKLQDRFERVSTLYTNLADEKHMLDKQVLSEEQTFEALATLFEQMNTLAPGRMPRRIVALAAQMLGGGSAAIYHVGPQLTGGGLRQSRIMGALDRSWPNAAPLGDPVVEMALRSSGPVTLTHLKGWVDAGAPDYDGIQLACRLGPTRSGKCRLVVMKMLPFVAFSPSRQKALAVAMRFASKAYRRARVLRRLKDCNVIDPVTKISSLAYLYKRLEEEHFLSIRHRVSFAVLTVNVSTGERKLQRPQLLEQRRKFAKAFTKCLRIGDLIALARPPLDFAVLCPYSTATDAGVVADRLREVGRVADNKTGATIEERARVHVIDIVPGETSLENIRNAIDVAIIGAPAERGGG